MFHTRIDALKTYISHAYSLVCTQRRVSKYIYIYTVIYNYSHIQSDAIIQYYNHLQLYTIIYTYICIYIYIYKSYMHM